MWVVAEPNVAAISYPSIKGDFSLQLAEAGAYQVQAFFAGQKVGPAVPVEAKGAEIKLAPIVVGAPKKEDKAE